jgi:RecA/RadA recombinase
VIAEAQKMGGICAFIDAEHAMDPEDAKKLGVNITELLISQPDNGEQALEITESIVRSGQVDVVVIDYLMQELSLNYQNWLIASLHTLLRWEVVQWL